STPGPAMSRDCFRLESEFNVRIEPIGARRPEITPPAVPVGRRQIKFVEDVIDVEAELDVLSDIVRRIQVDQEVIRQLAELSVRNDAGCIIRPADPGFAHVLETAADGEGIGYVV